MTPTKVNRLIIDIETAAAPDAADWLPEPKVDARIKDQAKIDVAREEKLAEALERAPLDADLATVRLISARVGVSGPPTIVLVLRVKKGAPKALSKVKVEDFTKATKDLATHIIGAKALKQVFPSWELLTLTEGEAIQWAWRQLIMCNGCSVGFNTMGFDLPFLMRRSMALNLQPGVQPSLAKYRDTPTTDLFGLLFNWSWGETKKLKWIAQRYGLEVLLPDAEGKDVGDMDDAHLIAYGLSDLHITTQLYRRMNGVYFNHGEV